MKKKVRTIQRPSKRGKLTVKQCRDAVKAVMAKRLKKDIVQLKNPKTGLYVKIDRAQGKILGYKKTKGKYANVKVARKIKGIVWMV